MSRDVLVSQLEKVGWSGFAPGEFLGVQFDRVGKAKIARNNWFFLLKSVPVLDAAGLDTWSQHYAHFSKRARAGMFTSGKYFVLVLLADKVAADAAQRLSGASPPGLLVVSDVIDRGGGSALIVDKGRPQLFIPKKIVLWDIVRATEFVRSTYQVVVNYAKQLAPAKGGPADAPPSDSAAVVSEKFDS